MTLEHSYWCMTHIRTVWIIVGKLRKLSVATSTYTSVYQKEKMPFSLLTESNILVTPLWRNSRTDIFSNDNYRNIFIIFSRYRHADAYFLICAKLPQCQCTRLCYDVDVDGVLKGRRGHVEHLTIASKTVFFSPVDADTLDTISPNSWTIFDNVKLLWSCHV